MTLLVGNRPWILTKAEQIHAAETSGAISNVRAARDIIQCFN